jgi:hypothetical protein
MTTNELLFLLGYAIRSRIMHESLGFATP